MTKPFLFCLRSLEDYEEWAEQLNKLSEMQEGEGGKPIKAPSDPFMQKPIINAPDYQELENMKIEREMQTPSSHQEKVP